MSEKDTPVKVKWWSSPNVVAIILIGVAALIAVVPIIMYLYVFSGPISTENETWGQFGDFFGGTLNPVFGFFSLMALIGALLIQTRELRHSTNAMKEQSDHLEMQGFEQTLFAIIRMNIENVREMALENDNPDDFVGRRSFRILYDRLKNHYAREKRETDQLDEKELIRKAFELFMNKNRHHLGHYLATFEEISNLIERRSPQDSAGYWKVYRSQVSAYELIIVFYFVIATQDKDRFDRLYNFGFFDNIDRENLMDPVAHEIFLTNLGGSNVEQS